MYEWLLENKIFYEKDKNIIKKIPKDLLLKSSFVKDVLNRYRISIVKRIKSVFAREGIEMVGASENDIFITNVTDELLSKIKNKINHQYQDIFLIRDIDKFLKNKSSILYKVNDKVKGINEYHYSKLIMPKNHKWISEILKLYFWEKQEIETAVRKVFSENPDIFFMYATKTFMLVMKMEKWNLKVIKC